MSHVSVSSRSLTWGGIVQVRYSVCVCVWYMMYASCWGHLFSVFSFLLCDDGKKDCYIYFITTGNPQKNKKNIAMKALKQEEPKIPQEDSN